MADKTAVEALAEALRYELDLGDRDIDRIFEVLDDQGWNEPRSAAAAGPGTVHSVSAPWPWTDTPGSTSIVVIEIPKSDISIELFRRKWRLCPLDESGEAS